MLIGSIILWRYQAYGKNNLVLTYPGSSLSQ